jgi:formylglycine-generating enzyme required for sulfatase activity
VKGVTLNEEGKKELCSQDTYIGEKIHAGSERFSLGLPASYTPTSTGDIKQIKNLTSKSIKQLHAILSGKDPLSIRYHAGMILSILGDPRITVYAPTMVKILGGSYPVGSSMKEIEQALYEYSHLNLNRKWLIKEYPKHEVEIADFIIGKYPVTNQEFLEFLLKTKYDRLPTSWILGRFPTEKQNHPVFNVLPEDIMAYINWLNFETGRQFRLPTEYEWEIAASGGDDRQYPWGDSFDTQKCNTVEGNVLGSTPVGMYEGMALFANGLCDMAGNVEEYVSDDYSPYPGGDLVNDHLNANNNHYRIARGGSFGRFGDLARCKRRHGLFPESVRHVFPMGFRLAETIY